MVGQIYQTLESRRKDDEEQRKAMKKIDKKFANETKKTNKEKMKFVKFLSSKFPNLIHGYNWIGIYYYFHTKKFIFKKLQFHLSNGFTHENGVFVHVINKDYLKDIEELCKEYESKNNINLTIFFDTK